MRALTYAECRTALILIRACEEKKNEFLAEVKKHGFIAAYKTAVAWAWDGRQVRRYPLMVWGRGDIVVMRQRLIGRVEHRVPTTLLWPRLASTWLKAHPPSAVAADMRKVSKMHVYT